MKILGVTEQRQGKWNNTSFETLASAQQLASALNGTVSALVIGKGMDAFAGELSGKNIAEVLQVEHELLETYTPDGYCIALKQVVESTKPVLLLLPHKCRVRVFAPKCGASLRKARIGECVAYHNE